MPASWIKAKIMQMLDSPSLEMSKRMRNVFWCLFFILVLRCQSDLNNCSSYLRVLEKRFVFSDFSWMYLQDGKEESICQTTSSFPYWSFHISTSLMNIPGLFLIMFKLKPNPLGPFTILQILGLWFTLCSACNPTLSSMLAGAGSCDL